jgi:hypothetical protein
LGSFRREGRQRQASRRISLAASFKAGVSGHEKARRLMPAGLISYRSMCAADWGSRYIRENP